MNWNELERSLASGSDRKRIAEVAHRAAMRLAPVIARAADHSGPEALEWLNAIRSSLAVTQQYIRGQLVSRFTLDLAADIARSAATAGANSSRLLGPSRTLEDAELAFAATAFAADVCRATDTPRAAMFAMQSVRAANASGLLPLALLEADLANLEAGNFGPLWPEGEPDWSREGWTRLHSAGPLPTILGEPA
jgi:hypothetical protein